MLLAAPPAWWTEEDTRIIHPTAIPSVEANHAPVLVGQLKNVAKQAKIYLDATLPGGAGWQINALIESFEPENGISFTAAELQENHAPVNLGQLKAVAKPFYDRLLDAGYDTKGNLIDRGYPISWSANYPWLSTTSTAENRLAANIGQLKLVFSFDLTGGMNLADADGDGLPDTWEARYFPNTNVLPNADPDGDGLTNLQEFQQYSDPRNYYSQGGTYIVPTIDIVMGNDQVGEPDAFAPIPFIVEIRNGATLLSNAPVKFSISDPVGKISATNDGNNLVSSLEVSTDTNGRAQVYFKFPEFHSARTSIQVSAGNGSTASIVNFTASTSGMPLSGLALWLRADAGVTKDTSNKVSEWADQSPFSNNAGQTAPVAQPVWVEDSINGNPILRFSGSQYLSIVDSASLKPTAITVLAVLKENAISGMQTLIGRPYWASGPNSWPFPYSSYAFGTIYANSQFYHGSSVATEGIPNMLRSQKNYDRQKEHLVAFKYDGSKQEVFLGGHTIATGSATGPIDYRGGAADIAIGAKSVSSPRDYLNSDVAEILVYHRALTPNEQKEAEGYLVEKYGLANRDTDNDGMPDWYEEAEGFDPLEDDSLYDRDGDGVPNQWEYHKHTAPNDKDNFPSWDWIVDSAQSAVSPSDNIVATINEALTNIPTINDETDPTGYKTILVRAGDYAEQLSIPQNKRIAFVAERGNQRVRLITDTLQIVYAQGKGVFDGFVITRPEHIIQSGIETSAGVMAYGTWRLANCIVSGHKADLGAIFMGDGHLILDHCTIFNNRPSETRGTAVSMNGDYTLILNGSILWNASSIENPEIFRQSNGTVIVSSSIIKGGEYGGTNVDPQLWSTGALKSTSPAIDADESFPESKIDIDGESRPSGGASDIGADEFVNADEDDLPDWWELENFGDLEETGSGDTDGDGLDNEAEFVLGTKPNIADTDNDGANDGAEIAAGSDPFDSDSDDDDMSDGYEIAHALNPLIDDAFEDPDSDRIPNVWESSHGTDPRLASSRPVASRVVALDGSEDYTTVKEAIDAVATDYEIVEIKAGRHVVAPSGTSVPKRILILGELGGAGGRTILAGDRNYPTLLLRADTVLDGLVITHEPSVSGEDYDKSGIRVAAESWRRPPRILVKNSLITGNAAASGGAVYISDGVVKLVHTTVIGNTSTLAAPLIDSASFGSVAVLVNSIVWNEGQNAPELGSGVDRYVVIDSIIRGGQYGGLSENPRLNADGILKDDSPARGAGGFVGVSEDIDNEVRLGGFVDLGWDEYVDSDQDGLVDQWEIRHFGNLDQTAADDPDRDAISNLIELRNETDPYDFDTDDDGLPNWWELEYFGSAGARPDAKTAGGVLTVLQAYEMGYDPADISVAGDGVSDSWKVANGYEVVDIVSTLRDGIPDGWKVSYGFSLDDVGVVSADPDFDGASNLNEFQIGSNPLNPRTADMGFPEGALDGEKVYILSEEIFDDATRPGYLPFDGNVMSRDRYLRKTIVVTESNWSATVGSFGHSYTTEPLTFTSGSGSYTITYPPFSSLNIALPSSETSTVTIDSLTGNAEYLGPDRSDLLGITTSSLTQTASIEKTQLRFVTPTYNPSTTPESPSHRELRVSTAQRFLITLSKKQTLEEYYELKKDKGDNQFSGVFSTTNAAFSRNTGDPQYPNFSRSRFKFRFGKLAANRVVNWVERYKVGDLTYVALRSELVNGLESESHELNVLNWTPNDGSVSGGPIITPLQVGTLTARLTSVEFVGAKLDVDGVAIKDSQGNFSFDRSLGDEPPRSSSQRLNTYKQWTTRVIHSLASKDDENYGIKGILRQTKGDTVQQENGSVGPLINLDRLLFKIRYPSNGNQVNQKVTVTPYVVEIDQQGNAQDVAGQPIDLDLVSDPNSNQLITSKAILLYNEDGGSLHASQVQAVLPPDVLLIKADKIGIASGFTGAQEVHKFGAKQIQIYIADGGAPVLEHDPVSTQSSVTENFETTGEITAGFPIGVPSQSDRRFFFWINEDDQTPDIRLTFRNEDGSTFGDGSVEWFVLYKFKAGNFHWRELQSNAKNPGSVYDIQQWHRLVMAELRLKDDQEIKSPEGIGGLNPGDYQLFCRVRKGDTVFESNLVQFKVLAKNPGDGGRNVRSQANATIDQLIPRRIREYVDKLPNPVRGGITFDLRGWYKGIICEESGSAPYSHRQDFDNFERVPESGGSDVGFERSIKKPNSTQWNVRFGFPLVGYDNGWGISQQTQSRNEDGDPNGGVAKDTPFADATRWKGNVFAGWKELISKVDEAIPYLKRLYGTTDLSSVPNERVIREAVKRYNGGTQYRDGGSGNVVERPSGNDYQRTYVPRVQSWKERIDGLTN